VRNNSRNIDYIAKRYGVLPSDILGISRNSTLCYSINYAVLVNSLNEEYSEKSKSKGSSVQKISNDELIQYQKEISNYF
jgi:hypothetical protein